MALGIHQSVNTCYGPGFIAEIRSDCYIVKLANWALAQGQSPTLYLQKSTVSPIPGAYPGTTVSTVYGPAQLKSIRADNTHIAKPINWKLANNTVATLYLQPEAVKLDQSSGFVEGDEVMTVYGQGYIEAVRGQGDIVVKLNEWALAQGQSPTLYLNAESVVKIPGLKIGSVVKTVYGMVKVVDIRRDGTHVCSCCHWNLAEYSTSQVKLYLAPEAFALMSLKP